MCKFCSFYYMKWRHLVNILPLDNAVLKFKHNSLLTLILKCAASNDLNTVDYAVWGVFRRDSLPLQKFQLSARKKCNCHSMATTVTSVS